MVEKTGELDPAEIVAMDLDAITTTQRDEEAKARQEKAAKKRTKSASPDIDLVEERPSKVCRTRSKKLPPQASVGQTSSDLVESS